MRHAFDKQAAEWNVRNKEIKTTHQGRIVALETLCRQLAPTITSENTNIQTLHLMVLQLQKQLAEQAVLLQTLNKGEYNATTVADISYDASNGSAPFNSSDIVPAMGSVEIDARLARATCTKGAGKGKTCEGDAY